MKETVKIVSSYAITRTPNTRGFYYVYITNNKFCTFRTIKAATAFCETLYCGQCLPGIMKNF